jgi:hypothetical protein
MSSPNPSLSIRAAVVLLAASAATGLVSATAATASATSPTDASPAAPAQRAASSPVIDAANFTAVVDNPWYPLVPGTIFTYRGTKDDKAALVRYEVTHETATIDGVPCVVVHDTLTLDGTLAEQTVDWYTQDLQGNVWYFGEDTRTLDASGKVSSTEGTWQAGVDGALPGIFMPAEPRIGQSFQQEYLAGQAEDRFVVTQIGVPVTVPFGTFKDGMLTVEWTSLEPDVLSEKAYIKGTGEVKELDVAGDNESLQLVSIQRP